MRLGGVQYMCCCATSTLLVSVTVAVLGKVCALPVSASVTDQIAAGIRHR